MRERSYGCGCLGEVWGKRERLNERARDGTRDYEHTVLAWPVPWRHKHVSHGMVLAKSADSHWTQPIWMSLIVSTEVTTVSIESDHVQLSTFTLKFIFFILQAKSNFFKSGDFVKKVTIVTFLLIMSLLYSLPLSRYTNEDNFANRVLNKRVNLVKFVESWLYNK